MNKTEFLEQFPKGKIAVMCSTEQQAINFINFLKTNGIKTSLTDDIIKYQFGDAKENLGYCVYDDYVSYCDRAWFIHSHYTLIPCEELIGMDKCELCSCCNTCNKEVCTK